MVAHSTVNRVVTGSSPVTGAKNKKGCLPLMGVALFIFMINKNIDDQQLSKVYRKVQEIFWGTLFGLTDHKG